MVFDETSKVASSANISKVASLLATSIKSLINIKNKVAERGEPCGIPSRTRMALE